MCVTSNLCLCLWSLILLILVSLTDGAIKVEPSGLNGRKGNFISCISFCVTNMSPGPTMSFSTTVFVHLACTFHYGSDNIIGVALRKNIWIQCIQVYPSTGKDKTNSAMVELLLKKAGEHSYPFSFQVREHHSIPYVTNYSCLRFPPIV